METDNIVEQHFTVLYTSSAPQQKEGRMLLGCCECKVSDRDRNVFDK